MSTLFRVLLLGAAVNLAACGGGGKSSPPGSVSSVSSLSSTSSVVSISSSVVSISSSVVSISSSVVSTSSSVISTSSSIATTNLVKVNGNVLTFDIDGDTSRLDVNQIDIQVHLLGANEETLQSVTPVASRSGNSDGFRFSADVGGNNGKTVAITVSYPGYTSYSRKLPVESTINVDAKLQAVAVKTVEVNEVTSISGVAVEGFNISVSEQEDSQQRDSMQIQIPVSLLPEGTESLDVAVRTFDPNNLDDIEFFPGAYADSDGNQLASVAFNFTEINTGEGEPLVQAMRKARQQKIAKAGGAHKVAADEPVIINRQIPAGSCRLLEQLGDSDALTPGFQVPVYTYNPNKGIWDLIGHGTVYSEQGGMINETQTQFGCDSADFYLEIKVTNEIFLSEWWNLDYPFTFTQPSPYCARIQLKNPAGESLAGVNGFAIDGNGSFDFTNTSFVTDAQGFANIRVEQSANETQATLLIYEAGIFGYLQKTIDISPNCSSPVVQVVELDRAGFCTVAGNLKFESGKPAIREMVYALSAEGSSIFGLDYIFSDDQGNYRLNLPCGGSYELAPISNMLRSTQETPWNSFSIDGTLQPLEQSDDGKSVVMKPITINYAAPFVIGDYDDEAEELDIQFFNTYSAFPMEYSLTITSADGKTNYGSFSGTVSANEISDNNVSFMFYSLGMVRLDHRLPKQSSEYYVMKLTVNDGLGNQWPDVTGVIAYRGTEQ